MSNSSAFITALDTTFRFGTTTTIGTTNTTTGFSYHNLPANSAADYVIYKPSYWFKNIVYECELCGSREIIKRRVEGKRPENAKDRYEVVKEICSFHSL